MTVARLFNAVGPRQASAYGMVLPRLVRQALVGDDLTVYGDGSQSRCFTHVRDTVDALVDLIDTDAAIGNVYNVGSSDQTTILDSRRGSSSARGRARGSGWSPTRRRTPEASRSSETAGRTARRSSA